MTVDTTWFRCPNCFLLLESVAGGVFGCANGHRFDRSKHGYLTLLPPRAPKTVGDGRSMLEARHALLASGAYSPIVDAMSSVLRTSSPVEHPSIADLGCGTGYYSAELAAAVQAERVLLADRSPDAVRWSLRHHSRAGRGESTSGVVLDLWRPLPVRDASADVVLDVFAPRNPPEYARILAPAGMLLVVVPTSRHLRELRSTGSLLEVPDGKEQLVTGQFGAAGLTVVEHRRVEETFATTSERRLQLAAMGPSAHHRRPGDPPTQDDADGHETSGPTLEALTLSVDILAFARPRA